MLEVYEVRTYSERRNTVTLVKLANQDSERSILVNRAISLVKINFAARQIQIKYFLNFEQMKKKNHPSYIIFDLTSTKFVETAAGILLDSFTLVLY